MISWERFPMSYVSITFINIIAYWLLKEICWILSFEEVGSFIHLLKRIVLHLAIYLWIQKFCVFIPIIYRSYTVDDSLRQLLLCWYTRIQVHSWENVISSNFEGFMELGKFCHHDQISIYNHHLKTQHYKHEKHNAYILESAKVHASKVKLGFSQPAFRPNWTQFVQVFAYKTNIFMSNCNLQTTMKTGLGGSSFMLAK